MEIGIKDGRKEGRKKSFELLIYSLILYLSRYIEYVLISESWKETELLLVPSRFSLEKYTLCFAITSRFSSRSTTRAIKNEPLGLGDNGADGMRPWSIPSIRLSINLLFWTRLWERRQGISGLSKRLQGPRRRSHEMCVQFVSSPNYTLFDFVDVIYRSRRQPRCILAGD